MELIINSKLFIPFPIFILDGVVVVVVRFKIDFGSMFAQIGLLVHGCKMNGLHTPV